jgi:uncharacterized iron-regulated membrane protein
MNFTEAGADGVNSGIHPVPAANSRPRTRVRAGTRLKRVALLLHRYVGLALVVFLVVAALTGSLLAFNAELDAALNPELYRAEPPTPGAEPLTPLALEEALARKLPEGQRVEGLPLAHEEGRAVTFFSSPSSPRAPASDDTWFVNPYDGSVLGSRTWGDISQGRRNLVPFVYRLHYSLALGDVGVTLFGIAALLWTFDCFVGAYLTFPGTSRKERSVSARSWLRRWSTAWLVRGGKLFSWLFTFHRASGLWIWGVLLVFAWSAVGLNLKQVYNPVMGSLFGLDLEPYEKLAEFEPPRAHPKLDFAAALHRGRELMAEQAALRGFEVREPRWLGHSRERGAYRYQVLSSLDISERYPGTSVWFDADNGELLAFDAATGQRLGNTVTSWLFHLHFGSIAIGGWPYRIFVSLMGLVISGLSLTGVFIWWKKRAKRRRSRLAA